jgi:hypothetical protein
MFLVLALLAVALIALLATRKTRPVVAALLVALLFGNFCSAQTEQRVAPPDDAGSYYLSIYGHEGDQSYENLQALMRTPEVTKAASDVAVKYSEVDAGSTMFATRYAATMPALPCIRIQRPDGTTAYQTTGSNVPTSREAIVAAITGSCPRAILPWNSSIRHRQQSQPQAAPQQATPPQEELNFTPTDPGAVQPDVEASSDSSEPNPWVVAAIVGVVSVLGAIGGAVSSIRKEVRAE